MGSLMGMMKDLYDEGDDQTKKIIGEAMSKAYSGKSPANDMTPGSFNDDELLKGMEGL